MARTIDLRKQEQTPKDAESASSFPPEQAPEPEPVQISQEFLGNKVSWTANPPRMRSLSTTVVVGVLAASAAVIWYFQGNLLFTILLAMGAVAFAVMPRQQRIKTRVVLAEEGIIINDAHYHYHELHSFWVTYVPGAVKELSLETAQWHVPYVKVPLGDQNPNHVRNLLVQYLPEKEHHASIIDALIHLIGL